MSRPGGAGRFTIAAIIGSVATAAVAYGLTSPIISLTLDRRGESGLVIGLLAAIGSLAVIVSGPFVPRLAARFGTLRALLFGVGAIVLAFAAFPLSSSLWLWFPLRFVAGLGVALHWILSETWLNAVADERNRGRVVALYVTVLACGFASGPVLITLVGSEGALPFLLGAAIVAVATVPLWLFRRTIPPVPDRKHATLGATFVRFPLVMLAGTLGGINDMSMIALLPVYGVRLGYVADAAALLLTIYMVGTIALQFPLGWLADRVDRRAVLVACAGAVAALAALCPAASEAPALLWPLLFVWGGVAFGLYTVGLTILGGRSSGADLAAANAAFVMFYEAGSMSGPSLSGAAIDQVGPHGLPLTLAALSLVFVVVGCVWRGGWGSAAAVASGPRS